MCAISARTKINRILSMMLAAVMLAGLLPSMVLRVGAEGETHTFTNGAIYLDETYSGDTVYILGDVDRDQDGVIDDDGDIFSVTVNGAQNVTIIFNNVTMDRRAATDPMDGQTVDGLYNVSNKLGWGTTAQTSPFLITGNSSVNAHFHGTCTFYAGTNDCRVTAGNTYTADPDGSGFAAIQVTSNASLTIEYANDLTVYGAHQLAQPDANGKVGGEDYSDVLRANHDITEGTETIYNDPYDGDGYAVPSNAAVNSASGGAGIGGGATYNTGDYGGTGSNSANYTAGTPGTIIINGGTIEAFGGHQAAGIGGGVNSAATMDKIVINNGTVTAHGGRWAAGIGDGDSVSSGASNLFSNDEHSIEINGGTVTAYGGVAAPGIGGTDDLGNTVNQLEIAVNGGIVNAFSGFPDGFYGSGFYSGDTNAPAAIGSGSKSNMASNSIYISSAATLTCAAFGNYSLTEIGRNANTIPTINVDSDGYLLLLRTANYYSSDERVLELYLPQTEIIIDAETGEERECYIYVDQSTGNLYYVDKEQYDVNKNFLFFDADGNQLTHDDTRDLKLTLYVDANSEKLDEIPLAYYFRSIALTLPHPEDYGGLYALTVPVEGIDKDSVSDLPDDDHIILTVEAHEQGTQSGVVTYPGNGNLTVEESAQPLTDLDAYEGNVTPSGNGLIGDGFLPGVYAYTVYVEPDCTSTTLYASFADAGAPNTYNLYLNDSSEEATDHGTYRDITLKVTLTGNTTTVRLKKIDNDNNLGAITYKVTFIKKGDYKLNLTDPSKVYDGTPATATVNSVYSGGTSYKVREVIGSDSVINETELQSFSLTGLRLSCTNRNETRYLQFDMTVQVLATDSPNQLYYVVRFHNMSVSSKNDSIRNPSGYYLGWTITYPENEGEPSFSRLNQKPNGLNIESATWISSSTNEYIATGRSSGQIHLRFEGTTIRIQYSTDTTYTLLEFGAADLDKTSTDTQATAYAQAQAAVKTSSPGGPFPYTVSETYAWTQPVSTYSIAVNSSGTKATREIEAPNYTKETNGYYEIVSTSSPMVPIPATQDELDSAVLTYYRIESDGITATKLDGPPTDAGTYRVEAMILAETYNASGSAIFTISQRPITILQIENWLTYMTSEELAELAASGATTLPISEPGEVLLNNVVSRDDLSVTVDTANNKVYYNDIEASYASDKISIVNPVLTGADAPNYRIVYTNEANLEVCVFGQISYDMTGSIFRKTQNGKWDKFYPVDVNIPVGEEGTTVDYHSPAETDTTYGTYLSHAEYVKARTVNESGAARYAVDLEYGAMQFTYYYSVWDVNELAYEETDGSYWVGMDGTNNKLTVTNYSNYPVYFKLSVFITPQYSDYMGDGTGITASIAANANGTGAVDGATWTEIAHAAAGNSSQTGSSVSQNRWLILTGVPQVPESVFTTVGSITLTVAPNNSS